MGCYLNDSNKRVLLLQLFCFIYSWWQKSRSPGFTLPFHCGITQYSIFRGSIQTVLKSVERIPKALLSLDQALRIFYRVSMQMEIAVGSQKTVHSAEEYMKIEGTGMMIREKDCTLHKLL